MEINISKTSWHYRVVKKMDWDPSWNLCPYFWQVVGALVLFTMFGITLTAIGGVALLPLAQWIPFWIFADINSYAAAALGIIEIGLLTWVLIAMVRDRLYQELINDPERYAAWQKEKYADKPHKEPNLLILYLRAAHDKVCPGLNFK